MRIGFLNVMSGMNITKGYWQYIQFPYKLLFPHSSKSINKIGEEVKKQELDFFGAVEIDAGSSRTKNKNQVDMIAKTSDLNYRKFFPTFLYKDRINQGNAIFSKHSMISYKNHNLKGKGEPRYLSETRIEYQGEEIAIFVTHLSLNVTIRGSQLHRLAKIIRKVKQPIILIGDFNTFDKKEVQLVEKCSLHTAITKPTFPSWNPKKHFDYIFLSSHFTINSAKVCPRKFSDHLMLIVDCEFESL